jgi:hypothetical protein
MLKLNLKLVAGAALSAALLAGCGGSVGGFDARGPIAQTITDVVGFIQNLFASGENTAPIDINSLTLKNDPGEPKPVQ